VVVFLCFILSSWGLSWFNPVNFVVVVSVTELLVLVFMVFLVVGLFVVFKRRWPIVLSAFELYQIVGLPSAVEKFSVVLGKVPIHGCN